MLQLIHYTKNTLTPCHTHTHTHPHTHRHTCMSLHVYFMSRGTGVNQTLSTYIIHTVYKCDLMLHKKCHVKVLNHKINKLASIINIHVM